MTTAMNLIPGPRLLARQRRIWRGRSVVTCAAYAVVVAAVTLAARTVIVKANDDVPEMLSAATADIDRTNQVLSRVRGELDTTESLLSSSRAIAEQPDWSLLLNLLAKQGNGDVMLKAVAVRPKEPPPAPALKPGAKAPAKPAAPPEQIILVSIIGAARSQADASQYALRLEATGLFGKVMLLDTSRETFADKPLVSFRLECTLGETAAKPLPAAMRPTAGATDLRQPATTGGEP